MKNRNTTALIFLLLLLGGGVLAWQMNHSATNDTRQQAVSHSPKSAQITSLEEPCPTICASDTQPIVLKPMSHQEEVAFLNQKSSFPFDNNFLDGTSMPKESDYRLQRKKNGYVLKMGDNSFLSTPSYADGHLYTSGGFNSRSFYAFNATSGKADWAVDLSDDGPSSALVLDSCVIFNTESCTVFALNRFTGEQLWAKWIGDPLLTHPVSDGKLVFTAYPCMTDALSPKKTERFKHLKPSHAFAAMDVKTGAMVWQRWLDGDVMTTPILHGEEIYVTTFSGTLYRLSKHDGKILKAANLQATSLPTIVGSKLYTTQRKIVGGKVSEAIVELDRLSLKKLRTLAVHEAPYLDYAVQKSTKFAGECRAMDALNGFFEMPEQSGWRKASKLIGLANVSSLQNFVGSTVVANAGKLYSNMGNRLVCLDIVTGAELWHRDIEGDLAAEGGHLATMPMILAKYLVSVTLDGKVLILDKQDGRLVKSYATETQVRNQPIVVAGSIYITSTDGKLSCIDTHNKQFDGWAMFLKNNAHDCGEY
jgi:outer membrane protein assembly factor BamB